MKCSFHYLEWIEISHCHTHGSWGSHTSRITESKFSAKKICFPSNSTITNCKNKQTNKQKIITSRYNRTKMSTWPSRERYFFVWDSSYTNRCLLSPENQNYQLNKTNGNPMQAWPDFDFATRLRGCSVLGAPLGWAFLPSFQKLLILISTRWLETQIQMSKGNRKWMQKNKK